MNYKKIIDNMFVDVNYGNDEETIHLIFEENYSNNSFFFKDDKEISKLPMSYVDDNSYSNDYCKEGICEEKDGDYQIIYDLSLQKVTITDNNDIFIDYFLKEKLFSYSDLKMNFEVIDGKISCNKSNCLDEENIYKRFYEKYIKKYEKD